MPAASCRTRPARSISLWLRASASAGSSRRVGTSDFDSRIYFASFVLLAPFTPGDELVDFLAHGAHDLRLRHLPDDLAALEDEPDPAPARDADVRRARLAGPVDLAPHHRDVDLLVQAAELVLDLLRELDQVHV